MQDVKIQKLCVGRLEKEIENSLFCKPKTTLKIFCVLIKNVHCKGLNQYGQVYEIY